MVINSMYTVTGCYYVVIVFVCTERDSYVM